MLLHARGTLDLQATTLLEITFLAEWVTLMIPFPVLPLMTHLTWASWQIGLPKIEQVSVHREKTHQVVNLRHS